MIRFLHSADWQIGKAFDSYGELAPVLREARLAAITAVGEAAVRLGVRHVLVAGDVYDGEQLTPLTRRQPMERMRRIEAVTWWLLPGNHDPHRPGGLWEQVLADGLAPNVRLLLEPVPVELEPGTWLLPAPLRTRNEGRDLSAWMDGAATPEGAVRIGLAHGSIRSFSQRQESSNPMDPARRASAGLAYLGLGDWHRTLEIGPGTWYAGTPEPDRPASQETGQVLLVEAGGALSVTPVEVGRHRWRDLVADLGTGAGIDALLAQWTGEASPQELWRLALSGALSLSDLDRLDDGLARLEAGLLHLSVDRTQLLAAPDPAELDALELGGVLGAVASRLRGLAAAQNTPDLPEGASPAIASQALSRLWRLTRPAVGAGGLAGGGWQP
jgi:hypothetical protein